MTIEETPLRPENMRYIHGDTGEEVVCELAYEGVDDEGLHAWVVTNPDIDFDPDRGDEIKIGVLPAMTGVGFRATAFDRENED